MRPSPRLSKKKFAGLEYILKQGKGMKTPSYLPDMNPRAPSKVKETNFKEREEQRRVSQILERDKQRSQMPPPGEGSHLYNTFLQTEANKLEASKQLASAVGPEKHILTSPPKPEDPPRLNIGLDSILVWSDHTKRHEEVPPFHLRANCQCKECIDPDTRQRSFDAVKDIPMDVTVERVSNLKPWIRIKFSDGHSGLFSYDFINRFGMRDDVAMRQGLTDVHLWSGKSLVQEGPPSVHHHEIMNSDKGVGDMLFNIRKFGFTYVDECPETPEASQRLLERIAYIRETHYGGFYDFTADLAKKDTAYTSVALDAHNDNTYFSDPAGLQMFHLLSHSEGSGGESLLVDGFYAASYLKADWPEAYEILSTVPVYSHASGNEGISIQPYRSFPVLVHDPQHGHLVQIRWNPFDRATIDMPMEDTMAWYEAAKVWSGILRDASVEYWEQLKPGKPLIFDNWRVLHGRSAFTGKRRMCGGYVNRDDWISRYKMLQHGPNKVLGSLVPTADSVVNVGEIVDEETHDPTSYYRNNRALDASSFRPSFLKPRKK